MYRLSSWKHTKFYKIEGIQALLSGPNRVIALSSKTEKDSKIRFYQNISNIENSRPSLGNSICTISIRSEKKSKFPFLGTSNPNLILDISDKAGSTYCTKSKESQQSKVDKTRHLCWITNKLLESKDKEEPLRLLKV